MFSKYAYKKQLRLYTLEKLKVMEIDLTKMASNNKVIEQLCLKLVKSEIETR